MFSTEFVFYTRVVFPNLGLTKSIVKLQFQCHGPMGFSYVSEMMWKNAKQALNHHWFCENTVANHLPIETINIECLTLVK